MDLKNNALLMFPHFFSKILYQFIYYNYNKSFNDFI